MVNRNSIFSFTKVVLLLVATLLFVNCKIIRIKKDSLIGDTTIERKFDENGALIYYKKINIKHKVYRHRPHMYSITRVTAKVIENKKVVIYYSGKSRSSMITWPDSELLKFKRIVWDENRKKTITRSPTK